MRQRRDVHETGFMSSESVMVNPSQKDRAENHRQRTKTRQRRGHVGFLVHGKTQFCEMQNTVAVK